MHARPLCFSTGDLRLVVSSRNAQAVGKGKRGCARAKLGQAGAGRERAPEKGGTQHM